MRPIGALAAGLAAALLLAGCALPGREPTEPTPTSTTAAELDPADRIRAVLARTGGDEMVGVHVSEHSVEVSAVSNGRIYTYGENDRNPSSRDYDGAARPFTLDDIDLAQIMTTTLETEASCAEPRWSIESVAYDMRLVDFTCGSGARYQLWPDGTLAAISTGSQQSAQDAFARLPAQAPDEVYQLVVSSQSQNGDLLEVVYADDQVGSVSVRLRSDEFTPVDATGGPARHLVSFALSEFSIDQVVACGQQQMARAENPWWFVDIRYSTLHDQVVMKWDTEGGWTSVGPLTTLACEPLEG